MSADSDLVDLATHLVRDGPHKMIDMPKRVRILFGGVWIIDATDAKLVWEHPNYPQIYLTVKSLSAAEQKPSLTLKPIQEVRVPDSAGKASIVRLTTCPARSGTQARSTQRVVLFQNSTASTHTHPLAGLCRIEFRAVDQWFLEDEGIYVHPKDPYKRIEIHASTRRVRVEIEGVTVAESGAAWMLHETGLPVRFYLPKPSILDWEGVEDSELTTKCPYKGEANYYNITVNGNKHQNVVWWYRYPTEESIKVTGLVCFYNEKVDIFLDGEKLERPKTHFA